ncbi:MAG: hypothetical protein AAF799_47670 [Myxococcota bacterium]
MTGRTQSFCTNTAVALSTLLVACAGHRPPPRGAAAVTVAAGTLPSGPAEPGRGLPMPSLDVSWMPPMLTAGDLEGLRAKLHGHGTVSLHLGERFDGPEWTSRLGGLLNALRPETSVLGQRRGRPFTGVTLPLRRRGDDGARPQYDWEGAALADSTEASAVLVLDDASVDPASWRALPAHAVGSCYEPMAALAAGQEQSLAELEPFLDHADAVLWQVYRPALRHAVTRLSAELEPYEAPRTRADFSDNAAWEQHECGHAYWQFLRSYAACGDEAASCPSAPRVFLIGGARIGTAEPSVYVPEGCAEIVGRDYVGELRAVASETAEVAQEHLAASWVDLADRLGAVTEVYEALEDVCTPRRRRFAQSDIDAMRGRLTAIGDTLASGQLAHPAGRWELVEAPFHVPGFGPVQQVAHYDAGPGSPSETAVAEARALRQFVLQRALCRSGRPALPLATAVVDGDDGKVEFFGYFFEEELFCGELPPLWEDGSKAQAPATKAVDAPAPIEGGETEAPAIDPEPAPPVLVRP